MSESYVPPCLYVSASPVLTTLLRRSVEMLAAKSTELSGQRRQRAQGLVEFTMSEAANFWLLHTANTFVPVLSHFLNNPNAHPEDLYLAMVQLAGSLYTFAAEGHPRDIPMYKHDDLGATFRGLEEQLGRLLETVIPTRCTPIPLERTRDTLFTGSIADERLLEAAQFYMAMSSGVPEEKVIREVPLKAKLSSRDRVDALIAQALRGLILRHLPTPPAEIPVQPGRVYFQVDKGGDHWEAIKTARNLSIYVPPEFTDLKIELMAVKE
jgi:type VI secretion system protein ImpJ